VSKSLYQALLRVPFRIVFLNARIYHCFKIYRHNINNENWLGHKNLFLVNKKKCIMYLNLKK